MIFHICFILFAYVNVLADDENDYIQEVDITNQYIMGAVKDFVIHERMNGLEFTVKRIVRGNKYSFEKMNFMLAVPDQLLFQTLDKCISSEKSLQKEIITALRHDRPSATGVDDIFVLGDERRKLVRRAIKNLFFYDMFLKYDVNYSLTQKCHLIGLATSTKNPLSYTENAVVDNDGVCVMNSIFGTVTKYKEFENQFWEVEPDQVDEKKERLLCQLE
ncbi:uncharacterized protein LOC126835551 [Adelges cooleyi]|uniref:uncharacterized protein LOC126835551 n=1 Tax=Adelges cooleyi TaxID=133065 RepID=UPI0021808A68|nr:uncharacterized protein LOC126835551 [Adelges cooleyi]XP_050424175.1 uncharacterized protein LOC126835551 [Adelges cooleyi]XP_050424176.1 uncharacterized protein LOC126835551 [Adelges cooleyi]